MSRSPEMILASSACGIDDYRLSGSHTIWKWIRTGKVKAWGRRRCYRVSRLSELVMPVQARDRKRNYLKRKRRVSGQARMPRALHVSTSSIIHCIVGGCDVPVIASGEVHDDDYSVASNLFRNKGREKIRTRRFGDERIYICASNTLMNDWRMAKVRWQFLIGDHRSPQAEARHAGLRCRNLPTGGNRSANAPGAQGEGAGLCSEERLQTPVAGSGEKTQICNRLLAERVNARLSMQPERNLHLKPMAERKCPMSLILYQA